ncbi:amino acid ABC transporter permease, partial [Rhizobium phaseoli]
MSHTFLEQLWIARYVIMNGIAMTVSISLLAILAGSVIGVFVGLALVYGGMILRLIVRAYTDIIRGTPVLVLVLASYYVSAAVGLDLGPFSAGVLALAIFCSSHVGEIVRGALQAIPKGQTEAAKAIGLTFTQTFTSVLWPQAMRQCLPAWVNT